MDIGRQERHSGHGCIMLLYPLSYFNDKPLPLTCQWFANGFYPRLTPGWEVEGTEIHQIHQLRVLKSRKTMKNHSYLVNIWQSLGPNPFQRCSNLSQPSRTDRVGRPSSRGELPVRDESAVSGGGIGPEPGPRGGRVSQAVAAALRSGRSDHVRSGFSG